MTALPTKQPQRPCVRIAAAAALALSIAAPMAPAQSRLQRDLEFVRQLATKLRFVSLAQSEVDRLKQKYKDGDDFQAVAQLGVEISLIGAKVDPDRERRRTLYKEALDSVQDFLGRYPEGPAALSARMTLADAALEFGRFLADEIELARAESPEKVKGLEEDARDVFLAGEEACDKVRAELEPKKDENQRAGIDYHLTWMRKGILLREHARAIEADREYLAARSRDTLEELIFEVGEETALGQRALFEHAQNDEVLGKLNEAVSSYNAVIDSADTVLTNEEIELPTDVQELMVITLEEAFERAAAVQLKLGDYEGVIKTVESYRQHLTNYGVPLTDLEAPVKDAGKEDERYGHGLYLIYAQALAESGQPDGAARGLKLVQTLNEWHPNDFVGLRAKQVLKEMLAAREGRVSGSLLLEVARGDRQAKDYERAVAGFKAALAAMTPAERGQLGLAAHYEMASCLALQTRFLEATLALCDGLSQYGEAADDSLKEQAADLVQRTMQQVRQDAKNDRFFDDLGTKVTELAAAYGSAADAAKQTWRTALRLLGERQYDQAINAFRLIPEDSTHYEWAQARIAACLQRKRDFAGARDVIAKYRAWRDTKAAAIPDGEEGSARRQVRTFAEAEIAFLEGYMLYLEGIGRDEPEEGAEADAGTTKDLTKFPEVIKRLADFESQHGNAASELVPRVLYVLGNSYVQMGDVNKAEESYRQLQKLAGRRNIVAYLATAIFSAYHAQVTAKAQEVEAIAKRGEDTKQAREELAALRRRAVALGLEYYDTAEQPQYQICFLTLELAAALRDWQLVESFGNKLVAKFGSSSDADTAEKVDKFVRPIVGDAVLRQHKYRQAYDMLVAAEEASPTNYPLKRLIALALGGWIEIDENGAMKSYSGLGKPAEAYEKYWGDYRTYGLHPSRAERYSLEWYRFHFEAYHFAREAARTDSKYVARAQNLFNIARSTDGFKRLEEAFGLEGKNLRDMFLDNPPN